MAMPESSQIFEMFWPVIRASKSRPLGKLQLSLDEEASILAHGGSQEALEKL